MSGAEVVVVGGGAVGVSCALALAREGAEVTLLEAAPALGEGCSGGSAGLLCPSHAAPLASPAALRRGIRWSLSREAPFALRPRPALLPWLGRFALASTPARELAATRTLRELALASLELHRAWRDEFGTQLVESGTLNVYETEAGFAAGRREAAVHERAGLRPRLLEGEEACAFEPALVGPLAGAIHYPDELSGDPLDFVRVVAQAAGQLGATIRTGDEVLALRAAGRRITAVETASGTLETGTVVLAAGVWTRRLARGLGLSLPLEGGKGYHLDYDAPQAGPRVPVFLREAHVVVTPLPGRVRLAGTLALSGLDTSIDARRLSAIKRAGGRRIRGLAARPRGAPWCGLRPCSPDGLPILGRPEVYDNLVLATGHGMLGFTLAPLSGRLVARLLAGIEPPEAVPLSPDRFRGLRSLLRPGPPHRAASD